MRIHDLLTLRVVATANPDKPLWCWKPGERQYYPHCGACIAVFEWTEDNTPPRALFTKWAWALGQTFGPGKECILCGKGDRRESP